MVLGTHPTKPYLRRIWVAPFEVVFLDHCTAPCKLGRGGTADLVAGPLVVR
jgi:hypothetical protein